MKTIAFLTNLNAAGMDQTGKFNPLYMSSRHFHVFLKAGI